MEAEYSAESAARLVRARSIAKIEKSDPNFHRKQVQSTRRSVKSGKHKYLGRQVKPNLTWGEKANIIYFHPNLGSKNVDLTCSLFDIKEPTLRGWLNNAQFVRKWLPGVRAANPAQVIRSLPKKACHGLDELMWYPIFSMMNECAIHPC